MQYGPKAIRLIALVRGGETRRSVRVALADYSPLRLYGDASELLAAARHFSPPCALLEIDDGAVDGTAATVRSLVECAPDIVIVGYCELTPLTAQRIVASSAVGLRHVVIRGVHDLATEVAHCFRTVDGERVRRRVFRMMGGLTPFASTVLHRALADLRQAPTVGQLALALAVPRRTLIRRFELAGLPTPHDLLGWARVLAAGVMLEGSEFCIEHVASEVGCPSAVGLRRLVFRYARMKPSQLREPGSVERLGAAYEEFLRRATMRARRSAPDTPRYMSTLHADVAP